MEDNRTWLKRFINAPIETRGVDGPSAGVVPPSRSNYPSVSVTQALDISAVFRAVSVICSSVSQMPLGVYGSEGYERAGQRLPTPAIIRSPDPNDSQRGFVYDTVYSLACYGNAYWRIEYDASYQPVGLQVLDPTAVTVTFEKGRKVYYLGANQIKNIKHLRLMRKPGQVLGFGPIQHGQGEIAAAYRLRQYADNWFNGSGMPTGFLTTDKVLSAAQSQEFVNAWKEFVEKNGTAVMSNGIEFKPLTVDPKNAQFIEVQQAHTVTISRLFGVPPLLLATSPEGSSMTYANQQDLWIQFLTTTLADYMNEIEGAFSSILPRTQEVRFEESTLLRMNTTAQVEVDAKQIESGTRTANELRARDGLSALAAPKPVQEQSNSNIGSETDGSNR